jgi:hypothetical protein
MPQFYRRNHVVSECLLKRFQNAEGKILRYDVARGVERLTRPGLEGFQLNLWRPSSAQTMETLWNEQAENAILRVLAKIDSREQLTTQDFEILARFCAIHFVRSKEFIKLYEYIRQRKASLASNYNHRLDFVDNYRVRLKLLRETEIPCEFFETVMTHYYYLCRDHLKEYGIEIGVATGGKQFILPDNGILIADVEEGKYQPSGGVALLQARQVIMPLSPTLLLAFRSPARRVDYIDLDDRQVKNANQKLLLACHEYHYQMPG